VKNRLFGHAGGDVFEDEADEVSSSSDSNEFEALLAGEKSRGFVAIKQGMRVDGRVLHVTDSAVVFDVGQRSEGILPTESMPPEDKAKYTVGSNHSLYVSSTANGIELTVSLSAKQAGQDRLRDAMNSGLPVEGKVTGENKGGYTVDVPGAKGFCPFSQMDIVSGKPPAAFIGQSFKFRVTKVSGRDVVLSRSALLREEQAAERGKVLESLTEGQTLSATVIKLENFGAFVDLGGGVHALVPMSELSWSRPSSAHSVVNLGEKVIVKILRIESSGDRPRISVSIKQVEGDPWDYLVEKLETGTVSEVRITKLMPFGAFAEIAPGLEGLIHISEMSARRRISTPGEAVAVDQKVQAKIVGIDRINRRISLSMKVLDADFIEQQGKKKLDEIKAMEDEHRGVEYRTKGATATLGDAFLKAAERAKR
jgi:small subunit ribosomal protein S1